MEYNAALAQVCLGACVCLREEGFLISSITHDLLKNSQAREIIETMFQCRSFVTESSRASVRPSIEGFSL